ncbi:MAG: acetyl-CoA carboxylase carboxyltransferase subunit alpha [Flavobacteriales bacterium]|nr:acetyl-CoA carboxylase carboxyltransferase subunit alpha [Flavobacteriales bacterium]
MNYLDFEEPIRLLRDQLEQAQNIDGQGQVDMQSTVADLEQKIDEVSKEIYSNLTPWQRVQVSRHPDRPYTLDHIAALTGGRFMELHGDRCSKDDKAMIGGLGMIDDLPVMFVGQQKGANTKLRQYRNFGMANPSGYRKALRLMKLAEKFNRPVVCLIDTPGAYPGLEAEERGQGEAIARNLIEMMQLRVPVVCVVIGEGASGGALGIGIGDRVLMMEHTWYSVISPESCSSILWRSWDHKVEAAEALKLTADDMLSQKLIDGIIPEPLGGAHNDREAAFSSVKDEILKHLRKLRVQNADKRIDARIRKFSSMGVVQA